MRGEGVRAVARWFAVLIVMAAAGSIAVPPDTALAGKPPPSPPEMDGGKIYYKTIERSDTAPVVYTVGLWEIAPDGSGRTQKDVWDYERTPGIPSLALHDGVRWYLWLEEDSTVTDPYPSGWSHLALFLGNDAGEGVEIALDDLLEPTRVDYQALDFSAWDGFADGKISFPAKEWSTSSSDDGLYDWGLYVLAIDWDAILASVSTSYPSVTPTVLGFAPTGDLVALTTQPKEDCAVVNYAWSDTGTSLAYRNNGGPSGIWQLDLADVANWGWSDAFELTADSTGALSWRGSWILYQYSGSIRKIPAGQYTSSPKTVVSPGKNVSLGQPRWSPKGTHFTYMLLTVKPNTSVISDTTTSDVYVATADGSYRTCLTSDLSDYAVPLFWRGTEEE